MCQFNYKENSASITKIVTTLLSIHLVTIDIQSMLCKRFLVKFSAKRKIGFGLKEQF